MSARKATVTIIEPYAAWQYEGGDTLPDDLRELIDQHGAFYVPEGHMNHSEEHKKRLRENAPNIDWDAPSGEYWYWANEGNQRMHKGDWCVWLEGGPFVMSDEEVQEVETHP